MPKTYEHYLKYLGFYQPWLKIIFLVNAGFFALPLL